MSIRQVNSERVVVLGWARAILLQLAHPLVGAAAQHSVFRGSALQAAVRLHRTVSAMLSLMFGPPERRVAAAARIRAAHARVNGILVHDVGRFPKGTRYSATDPALLLWVHATLVDSTAAIYDRVVSPLSTADLDLLCREAAPLLEGLGGEPETIPRTWADLQQYLDRIYSSDILIVTDRVREIGDLVMAPRAAGVRLPIGGVQRLITAGMLPPPIRRAYGFEWNPARERRFNATVATVRRLRSVAPRVVAQWGRARCSA